MLLVQAVDNLIGPLVLALLDVDSGKGLRKDTTVFRGSLGLGRICFCSFLLLLHLFLFLLFFLLLHHLALLIILLLILVELESAFFYEVVDEGDGS